ncbi:MAG TPA: hypothetical protein DCL54_04740 [Alphaproteobacteria bacterium]|nr:hypothetical protein [Alphaproteobacteria bacterium]HAJ45872.1 hypothetical protein [Alphaproteobacteria bacterium]
MSTLATALALESMGPNEWRGRADPAYVAAVGMYGGFTAAQLLYAITQEPAAQAQGQPSALTVHFLNRIEPGAELTFRTRTLPSVSKSHGFWQVEVFQAGQDMAAAAATVILTTRREGKGFSDMPAPKAPPPEDLEPFQPPFPYAERTIKYFAQGFPPFNRENTYSLGWSRETSGRAVDAVQLAFLADNFPPRIWFTGADLRPSATMVFSLFILATPEELAAIGDDAVLMEVTGTRGAECLNGTRIGMWSRSGVPLATSEQLNWYK